jgi:hypothetical protein
MRIGQDVQDEPDEECHFGKILRILFIPSSVHPAVDFNRRHQGTKAQGIKARHQ